MNESICRILEWDSEFFDRKIASFTSPRLTVLELGEALDWCGQNAVDCLYYLADSGDIECCNAAERKGFLLADIRITLERSVTSYKSPFSVEDRRILRHAREGDLGGLRLIAGESHPDSRFYADSQFSREKCSALYKVWIEKSCRGYADAVLVAESAGKVAGYVSCHLKEASVGQIGLAGIDKGFRGRGYGTLLVHEALDWFAGRSISKVSVVTQGRNIKAQRLYEQCGFFTSAVQIWFHRWFTQKH